jgi:hypothetical protein
MGVTDGARARLRLLDGRAAAAGAGAQARCWHPSQGGRPPRLALTARPGAGDRARQRWGGGGRTVGTPSTITPIDKTIGMLIEVAAWR